MKCKFSNDISTNNKDVKIQNHEIPKNGYFCYIVSIINEDGEIVDGVIHRNKIGWFKWSDKHKT